MLWFGLNLEMDLTGSENGHGSCCSLGANEQASFGGVVEWSEVSSVAQGFGPWGSIGTVWQGVVSGWHGHGHGCPLDDHKGGGMGICHPSG